MTAAMIAQIVVALGPTALRFISELVSVWDKPSLTADEIMGICSRAQKSYDDYINEAKKPPTA